jgi:hypothetical protein
VIERKIHKLSFGVDAIADLEGGPVHYPELLSSVV